MINDDAFKQKNSETTITGTKKGNDMGIENRIINKLSLMLVLVQEING